MVRELVAVGEGWFRGEQGGLRMEPRAEHLSWIPGMGPHRLMLSLALEPWPGHVANTADNIQGERKGQEGGPKGQSTG